MTISVIFAFVSSVPISQIGSDSSGKIISFQTWIYSLLIVPNFCLTCASRSETGIGFPPVTLATLAAYQVFWISSIFQQL